MQISSAMVTAFLCKLKYWSQGQSENGFTYRSEGFIMWPLKEGVPNLQHDCYKWHRSSGHSVEGSAKKETGRLKPSPEWNGQGGGRWQETAVRRNVSCHHQEASWPFLGPATTAEFRVLDPHLPYETWQLWGQGRVNRLLAVTPLSQKHPEPTLLHIARDPSPLPPFWHLPQMQSLPCKPLWRQGCECHSRRVRDSFTAQPAKWLATTALSCLCLVKKAACDRQKGWPLLPMSKTEIIILSSGIMMPLE